MALEVVTPDDSVGDVLTFVQKVENVPFGAVRVSLPPFQRICTVAPFSVRPSSWRFVR